MHGELVTGSRTAGRPYLRYRDTCKRDMNMAGIDTTTWGAAADDRGHWRSVVKTGMRRGEKLFSRRCKEREEEAKVLHPAHPPQQLSERLAANFLAAGRGLHVSYWAHMYVLAIHFVMTWIARPIISKFGRIIHFELCKRKHLELSVCRRHSLEIMVGVIAEAAEAELVF